MKNIYTILETIGIQIPADKKSDFDTAFNENYKTVCKMIENKEITEINDDEDFFKRLADDDNKW